MKNNLRKQIEQTPLHDWLDNQEVMQYLHICQRTLHTLRSTGTLPYSRINNKLYYRRQDIQKLLAENYTLIKTIEADGTTKK